MEGNQSAKTIKDMLINIAIGNADKADKDLKDFDKSLRTVRGSAHAAERSVNNLLAAFGAGYTIDLDNELEFIPEEFHDIAKAFVAQQILSGEAA